MTVCACDGSKSIFCLLQKDFFNISCWLNKWPFIGLKSNRRVAVSLLISKVSQMPHEWIPASLHFRLSSLLYLTTLTSKWPGWYLNFSTWFTKNILFEQKKIEFWHKWHFMENKTEIVQHILTTQYISLLPKYIK